MKIKILLTSLIYMIILTSLTILLVVFVEPINLINFCCLVIASIFPAIIYYVKYEEH